MSSVKWQRVQYTGDSAGDSLKFSINYELILWYDLTPLKRYSRGKKNEQKEDAPDWYGTKSLKVLPTLWACR